MSTFFSGKIIKRFIQRNFFTVDFVSKSIGEIFKNLPPDSQKKRQNSAKKIIKKSFLEQILLKF